MMFVSYDDSYVCDKFRLSINIKSKSVSGETNLRLSLPN